MKIFGFAGFSGSGKTTLIERLIPLFVERGLRVSLIKHAHHTFDVDQPGKDSYRHRHAGATEVLVTSSRRWVLMHELRGESEPSMDEIMTHVSPCDLLLVEGYKRAAIPKIEVYRASVGEGFLHPHDPHVVAIATDRPFDSHLPVLDLDQPPLVGECAARLERHRLQPGRKRRVDARRHALEQRLEQVMVRIDESGRYEVAAAVDHDHVGSGLRRLTTRLNVQGPVNIRLADQLHFHETLADDAMALLLALQGLTELVRGDSSDAYQDCPQRSADEFVERYG